MCGKDVYFYCPNCNYKAIVELGMTNLVKYKDEELALQCCPKCKTKIAFNVIDFGLGNLGNAHLNRYGAFMKEDIIFILSANLQILKKSEEDIVSYILNELKKIYDEDYMNKYSYEIRTILEYVLIHKLYVTSYIYETIKYDCINTVCMCY